MKTKTRLLVGGFTLLALLLRALYLGWQPLWWDEGYSIYFATEPLGEMVRLTALDIHPPLYYAALHGWISALGQPSPQILRSFSVMAGTLAIPLFGWVAHSLFRFPANSQLPVQLPISEGRSRALSTNVVIWLGMLLFVLNPLHLHYSQEVRMYALALAFTLWSTGSFWRLVHQAGSNTESSNTESDRKGATPMDDRKGAPLLAYVVSTTLALYTLYYSALIPVAHLIYALYWIGLRRIKPLATLRRVAVAHLVIGLLYLPWVLYAAIQLITYVSDKIGADNDIPLSLPAYLGRHLVAFLFGQVPVEISRLEQISVATGWATIVLIALLIVIRIRKSSRMLDSNNTVESNINGQLNPVTALAFFLLIPLTLGFLLNLVLPFFPEGGERLMLMVLPYFLLLMAVRVASIQHERRRYGVMFLLVALFAAGIGAFYMVPRHEARDYRGLVRHVVQNGQAEDRVLTIFPWQVGYWRAYSSLPFGSENVGPTPSLLGAQTLEWSSDIQRQIDTELTKAGALWFPAPLGLGSNLPKEIERYLYSHSDLGEADTDGPKLLNFDASWANPTTFLTGWRSTSLPLIEPTEHSFELISLAGVGIAPSVAASANELLTVGLRWSSPESTNREAYRVTLRLDDSEGNTWSQRDYQWLNSPAIETALDHATNDAEGPEKKNTFVELSGIVIPVGLTPQFYEVKIGLSKVDEASGNQPFASIGTVEVVAPTKPLSPIRLPVANSLRQPVTVNNVTFIGSSGIERHPTLAGTEVPLRIHLQNQHVQTENRNFYLSMLDQDGGGLAGWVDWPLPHYPITEWAIGSLVQLPAPLQIPATVPTGKYRLIAGFVDPQTTAKSEPVELGIVEIVQRQARFEAMPLQTSLADGTARFGTHVDLLGFDLAVANAEAQRINIQLYWRVAQTLLPAHHIFVHLVDEAANNGKGLTLAQHDDTPILIGGSHAPTGSWQPDEYLTTQHVLNLPSDVIFDGAGKQVLKNGAPLQIQVGLYLPSSGARLPVSINAQPTGDNVILR